MSGRQLASTLAAHDETLRVLYMSGYTEDAVLRRGTVAGDVAFLEKPFSLAQLGHALHRLLAS